MIHFQIFLVGFPPSKPISNTTNRLHCMMKYFTPETKLTGLLRKKARKSLNTYLAQNCFILEKKLGQENSSFETKFNLLRIIIRQE